MRDIFPLSKFAIFVVLLLSPIFVLADVETTIRRPDGTVEKTLTRTLYDPWTTRIMLTIHGVSVIFGGIIAYGGIRVVLRSLNPKFAQSEADVDLDFKKLRFKIKKVSQGSLIVLIGAAIIGWSVYRIIRIETPLPIEMAVKGSVLEK